ncbi:MAG TPA: hypothetical protein VL360_09230 [Gammaproteobacteria bacterium]|nr:hypothetical protein [Gammaproteobacteria bacterium]
MLLIRDQAKDLYIKAQEVSIEAMSVESKNISRKEGLRRSNKILIESIQKITYDIDQTQWQESDLIHVMKCYKEIIHNLVNSNSKNAYKKAAMMCDHVCMFYDDYTIHHIVSDNYYYEVIDINLMYVRYAQSHYSGRNMLEPEIKAYLYKRIEKVLEIIDWLRSPDNVFQMHKISRLYLSICNLYLDLNDSEMSLSFALKTIRMIGRIRFEGAATSDDYLKLSELFEKISRKLTNDLEYHALFDIAYKFFSGNKVVNLKYFKNIIDICSRDCDKYDLEKIDNLHYIAMLMINCSVDDALPDTHLKMELQEVHLQQLLSKLQERRDNLMDDACDEVIRMLSDRDGHSNQMTDLSVSSLSLFADAQCVLSQAQETESAIMKLAAPANK